MNKKQTTQKQRKKCIETKIAFKKMIRIIFFPVQVGCKLNLF